MWSPCRLRDYSLTVKLYLPLSLTVGERFQEQVHIYSSDGQKHPLKRLLSYNDVRVFLEFWLTIAVGLDCLIDRASEKGVDFCLLVQGHTRTASLPLRTW